MSHDPIASRDAELQLPKDRDGDVDDALDRISRAWQRLDAFEPGLRALIEGAFSQAKFRFERLPTQRVAIDAGIATIIAYAAHRADLARPLLYRLVGTLSWDEADNGGRFGLVWDEQTLQYGESERHVSFPASIRADGSVVVNGDAFLDAVLVAMS
jgi:hypothetical protein